MLAILFPLFTAVAAFEFHDEEYSVKYRDGATTI
jgi:hypothetical protein